jgi:hypothetical protein
MKRRTRKTAKRPAPRRRRPRRPRLAADDARPMTDAQRSAGQTSNE